MGEYQLAYDCQFYFSSPPAFLAIGCGSGCLTVLVGRSSLPLPPWVTRRGTVWRGKASHHLQHGQVTPQLPGARIGGRSAAATTTILPPCPSARPASSIPLLLPPYCITCSVHVWQGAKQQSWLQDSRWQGGDQSVLQHCSSYTNSSS